MSRVKITVIDTTFNEKLAKEYGAPDIYPGCDTHHVGQVYYFDGGERPEGLCNGAWTAFEKYAFALAWGAEGFWPNWIAERKMAICSCNDGLRPAIFKLEVVDDE